VVIGPLLVFLRLDSCRPHLVVSSDC
jgi:hypothetical protein